MSSTTDLSKVSIDTLNLTNRVLNALMLERIYTAQDILKVSPKLILRLPNMGRSSMEVLINSMRTLGFDATDNAWIRVGDNGEQLTTYVDEIKTALEELRVIKSNLESMEKRLLNLL